VYFCARRAAQDYF
nr:immunoglobulin heavy chain junction region [Mus musculus]